MDARELKAFLSLTGIPLKKIADSVHKDVAQVSRALSPKYKESTYQGIRDAICKRNYVDPNAKLVVIQKDAYDVLKTIGSRQNLSPDEFLRKLLNQWLEKL